MGVINVLEAFLCRYSEFPVCLERTKRPENSIVLRHKGVGVTDNLNHGFKFMLNEGLDWVWMLSDGCVFRADLLTKLLDRDVDIVVPFSLDSTYPHLPELYEKDYTLIDKYWLKEQTGVVATELLTGFGGMLARRQVIEAIEEPWFVNGRTMPDRLGGDIWFCEKAIEKGFKVHIDFENTIGNIAHFGMWPQVNEGRYSAAVLRPMPWL